MNLKKKILYSVDAGLFISATILLLLSELGTEKVTQREIISGFLFGNAYFMFPFIDMEKKDKFAKTIGIHCFCFLVSLFALYYSLQYYMNNMTGGFWLYETLAGIGMLISFSYASYIFIAFVRALLHLITKIKIYIFGETAREHYSATKKIIDGITAFFVALAAMVASVSAFIASIGAFLK